MANLLSYLSEAERGVLQRIVSKINAAKYIALATHMRPDGDAFGSTLALAVALLQAGKKVVVCNESDIPANLSFIKETELVTKELPKDADLYIAADCADIARLGALAEPFKAAEKHADTVNIDHHISNTFFAKENFVRVCAANCMNVLALLRTAGMEITNNIANLLTTGLLTDSGCFSHDDVSEEVFETAAYLKGAGAEISKLHYALFKKQSKTRALLYGETMSKMKFDFDDRFAYIVITREMLARYNAPQSVTEGFVDFPLSVDGVEICASIMEVKQGQYKISLRSKSYADVNKLAGTFGGGGHVRAAGCMLNGSIYDVVDKLSYAVSQYLE